MKTLTDGYEGALIANKLRVLTATEKLPALVHAKIILADHNAGYLGSANFSGSALDTNFELGVGLSVSQVTLLESLLSLFESQGLISEVPY